MQNTNTIAHLRAFACKQKVLLGLVVAVWFFATCAVSAHEGHDGNHQYKPENHCALCLAQSTLGHTVTSFSTPTLELLTTQVSSTPLHINVPTVLLQTPGNRDPPFIL